MRKRVMSLLILAVATLTASTGAQAAPPQKSVFQFRGLNGQASWSDFNGCQLSSVQVIGNENVAHDVGGKPVTTDFATVIYVLVDFCTGQFRFGSGSGEAVVSGSLQSMTITGTIPINDSAFGALTATLDVTLTATGEVTRGVNNFHTNGGGTTIVVRSIGATADATPGGSVTVDGVNIVAGLAPGDSAIAETNGGSITIFH
jgi:hypothetical protein